MKWMRVHFYNSISRASNWTHLYDNCQCFQTQLSIPCIRSAVPLVVNNFQIEIRRWYHATQLSPHSVQPYYLVLIFEVFCLKILMTKYRWLWHQNIFAFSLIPVAILFSQLLAALKYSTLIAFNLITPTKNHYT